jgi:hypothetical protein
MVFRYPPAWRSYSYRWASAFTSSLTYLSTVPFPNPCHTTPASGGIDISCGLPTLDLGRTGVLITWTQSGVPHPADGPGPLANIPGDHIRLAGHPARRYSGPAGSECGDTGAATSIRAAIATAPQSGYQLLQMTACLAPDKPDGEHPRRDDHAGNSRHHPLTHITLGSNARPRR